MELSEILTTENIAAVLCKTQEGKNELAKIANQVKTQYDDDVQSLADKKELIDKVVKLAKQINEQKAHPWENASNVIFPLISAAAIEFNAKAYPEICQDGFIVKAKVYGNDEGEPMLDQVGRPMLTPDSKEGDINKPIMQNVELKEKTSKRIVKYMNWQLNEEIDNWEENQDKLLMALPVVGMMFKRTFFDKNKDKIVSELIYPDKFIVNNSATSLEDSPSTLIRELYSNQVQEKIRSDIFIDFVYSETGTTIPQSDNKPAIQRDLHTFLDQYCWYDLDKDGLSEPYAVTIHIATNTVVRMIKRFDKNSIKRNKKNEIRSIDAINIFTTYSFFPAVDGSFYSTGLGELLYNTNKVINSNINQLIDAGTLKNTGGGVVAKNLKIAGGNYKFKPGEYKAVDSFGQNLRDSFFPIPTPEPSQTLFALLGLLIESGKDLSSLREVITGEQAANIQATTMMALVEQGVKQFKAIYKRVYLSMKAEFKLIFDINADILNNKKYAEVLDLELSKVDVKADYNKKGFNIVPVADASNITNSQRMAKGGFLMQFLNDPYMDHMALRKRIFAAFNIEDKDKLIIEPAPQAPGVEDILAKAELDKAANRSKEVELKAMETLSKIKKEFDNIVLEKEKILAEISKIKSDAIKNIADAATNEKEIQLKTIIAGEEAIRKDIESQATIREREINKNISINQEQATEVE